MTGSPAYPDLDSRRLGGSVIAATYAREVAADQFTEGRVRPPSAAIVGAFTGTVSG